MKLRKLNGVVCDYSCIWAFKYKSDLFSFVFGYDKKWSTGNSKYCFTFYKEDGDYDFFRDRHIKIKNSLKIFAKAFQNL